jgi:ATP-binding cassette, subfamily B, bacterial PglK
MTRYSLGTGPSSIRKPRLRRTAVQFDLYRAPLRGEEIGEFWSPHFEMTINKLFSLFEPRERRRLGWVFGAMIVAAIAEVLGVASILPFMSLVMNPAMVHDHALISRVFEWFGFQRETDFLLALGIGVLALITLSNALAAFTTWLILRYIASSHYALSYSLLRRYVHAPYSYFLRRNTSELSKNILEEANTLMNGVILPLMQAFAKGTVALFILGFLVIVHPLLALSVTAVFGGAYGVIYFSVRGRQRRIGQERLRANAIRYKVAAESLGGIKDLKILGREDYFLARYAVPCKTYVRHSATNAMLGQLPRHALEVAAFGSILIMVLFLLADGSGATTVLPMVSLYAVAGYRLMPALQQIYHGISQVRFNGPILDNIHGDLAQLRAESIGPEPALQPQRNEEEHDHVIMNDVTFRYSPDIRPALSGLSISIPRNQSVALVGQTGSGKSTAVDVILGLLRPEQGSVKIMESSAGSGARSPSSVGYVPQNIFLSDDTIRRNIALGLPDNAIDESAVRRAATIAHLNDFVAQLPQGYDTVVGERGVRLSGGQRQRIGIARALYSDPEILILDEATSALDGVTEDAVMQAVRELAGRKTLLIIAHRLSTVRECHTIHVMVEGRIVTSGSYEDLLKDSDLFRRMAHTPRVRYEAPAGVA